VSSFDEVRVQKKLVKEGKIEVVENPRFLMDARPKELERRQRKISLFPHHHHRSESHAAAIGVSAEPLPASEGSPPSKATGSLSKATDSPSKRRFIGSLKGLFGPPTVILTHAAT